MGAKAVLTGCSPLARLLAENGAAEVDKLHDTVMSDDDVLELEITVGEARAVEVVGTCQDLHKGAIDLVCGHLPGHHPIEEAVRCVLHDLEPGAIFIEQVQGLDDVGVVESTADAELGGDLAVVFS